MDLPSSNRPQHWQPPSALGGHNKNQAYHSTHELTTLQRLERDLLAMPARLGSIALTNPTQVTEASAFMTFYFIAGQLSTINSQI